LVITAFEFLNAGTAINSHSIKNASNNNVVGVVQNENYNWKWFVDSSYTPPAVSNSVLTIPGMDAGNYTVTYRNTLTNAIVQTQTVTVSVSTLTSTIPPTVWDMYFTVEPSAVIGCNNCIFGPVYRN
jgi:hypothetical protein